MSLSSELKARARQTLTGKYLTAVSALAAADLIYALMAVFLIPAETSGASHLISMLCSLIVLFLMMILLAGTNFLYLNFARGEAYHMGQIFFAFSHHPDKVILITAVLLALCLVCGLPFAMAYLLASAAYTVGAISLAALIGVLILAALLSLALVCALALKYMLVFYLYIDCPELTWLQLLAKSRQLMSGNQLRCIRLLLSFLGLLLLCLLSLGIALLWVIPYINMTITYFYLEAAGQDQ